MKTKLMILLSVVLLMCNACDDSNGYTPEGGGDIEYPDNPDPDNPDNPDPDNPDNPDPDNPDNPEPTQRLPRPQPAIVPIEGGVGNPDAFYIKWKPVPNAAAYEWTLNGGEPQRTEQTQILFENLGYGDFTVNVKAVSGSKEYKDSMYASLQFSNRPSIPVYEAWLGEYTMTSEKTLVHPTENEGMIVKDEPVTLDVKLDTYGAVTLQGKVYYGYKVYGLSKEFPLNFSVAIFDPESPDEVKLLNQVTYGEADGEGFLLQWMGYGEYEGQISIVPGPQFFPITFTRNADRYNVVLATCDFKGGKINFMAYDLLKFNATENLYHSETAISAYGPFTMVRNADVAAPRIATDEPVCTVVEVGRD